MLRSVLGKSVHDHWRVIAAWAVFSGVWPAFYVMLYPSMGAAREMQALMDQMPPAFRALFAAQGLDLSTAEGYLNIELFSFVAPLLVMAVTVALGGSATAGEEERGTIDLLLANPIPRWRVVVEKAAAIVVASAVVGAGIWLGVAIGAALGGVTIDLSRVGAATVSATLLGWAFGALALAIGALTGRRMLGIGIALALAVGSYFVSALAPLVAGLEPWRVVSPFYHYGGYDPLKHGLAVDHALVLVGISLAALVIAVAGFERRDLRG